MNKRLQVLIEDAEYRRLQAVARRSGRTLAEWVRQALRNAAREESSGSTERKLAAIRAAAKHEFPTADIEQMLGEIAQGRDRNLP